MIFPAALLLLSTVAYNINAHGYLTSPPPRGIQKAGYQIDDLKSPNNKGLCRGEPEGQVTNVTPGQTLRLGFTITAPHIGPCEVYLLDFPSLGNPVKIGDKYNCAAPGGPGFWDIKLPTYASGRKVIRWYWEGRHISTPGEPYEQCIDVNFGGSGGDNVAPKSAPPAQKPTKKPKGKAPKKSKKPKKKAAPKPKPKPKPKPQPVYEDEENGDDTNDYGDEAPANYDQPATPPPTYGNDAAPATDGGKCTHGAYTCRGGAKYAVCNWGQWVNMACATGTTCQQNGNFIVCG